MFAFKATFLHGKEGGVKQILFRRRIEVLHEIALRLRELSMLPPFRPNRVFFISSEHFQQ